MTLENVAKNVSGTLRLEDLKVSVFIDVHCVLN